VCHNVEIAENAYEEEWGAGRTQVLFNGQSISLSGCEVSSAQLVSLTLQSA
jgi:hypothetical protein